MKLCSRCGKSISFCCCGASPWKRVDSIAVIECYHFWSDWTTIEKVKVDLDKWVFFEVDYRGENAWHLVGHRVVDEKNYKWGTEELSDHGICRSSLIDFIIKANGHGKYQRCKVSRFNNLHYFDGFYKELTDLLNDIKKRKEKVNL